MAATTLSRSSTRVWATNAPTMIMPAPMSAPLASDSRVAGTVIVVMSVRPPPGTSLLVADALGLGLFALSGAQLAESVQCPPLIVVLMGTMTGVTGGILRDVITARVPLVLRREIYATAAIAGVALYLALQAFGVSREVAFVTGIVAVVALRLLAIRLGLHLSGIGKS